MTYLRCFHLLMIHEVRTLVLTREEVDRRRVDENLWRNQAEFEGRHRAGCTLVTPQYAVPQFTANTANSALFYFSFILQTHIFCIKQHKLF